MKQAKAVYWCDCCLVNTVENYGDVCDVCTEKHVVILRMEKERSRGRVLLFGIFLIFLIVVFEVAIYTVSKR